MNAGVERWISDALIAGPPASQLELHLQPVVSLETGAAFGAESFLRWRHPERGVVAAMQWLPEAERSGRLPECTRSVLPEWIAAADLPERPVVSLNVGGTQLCNDGFMEAIAAIPPDVARRLAIEIHHLQFAVDTARVVAPAWSWTEVGDLPERLAALQRHGLSIWLDDYGDYDDCDDTPEDVLVLPCIDLVKLDRSLLDTDPNRLADLTDRIHGAGKHALIEGIETTVHLEQARAAGIDLGQGFFFAPPLTIDSFAAFLTTPCGYSR